MRQRPEHRRTPFGSAAQGAGHPACPPAGLVGALQDVGRGDTDGVDDRRRGAHRVLRGVGEQRRDRGGAAWRPVVGLEVLGLRADVEQELSQVDGVHAVDQGLVGLGEDRDPVVAEALDEVDLPQRTAAVQRPRDDPRDELEQLLVGARTGQGRSAHVVGEVEGLVVGPHRAGQPTRDRHHALAVAGDERDPVGDQLDEAVVVEPGVADVEDLDRRVVPRRGRLLGAQECPVT